MIALFKGRGLVASLIRWQTRGGYSHAAWICQDGSLIEAWHMGGVRHVASPATGHGPNARFDVYSVRGLSSAQHHAVESFLRYQIGSGYDFLAILRFLSRINRNNYDRWFCSELVAEALEEAGRPVLNVEAFRISPVALSWSTELVPVALDAQLGWYREKFGMTRSEWMRFEPVREKALPALMEVAS